MRKSAAVLAAFLTGCGGAPPFARIPFEPDPSRYFAPPTGPRTELLSKEALTVDDAMALAEAFHPELAALRLQVDISGAEAWDAGLVANPKLVLEVEDYTRRGGFEASKRVGGIAVDVPLGGRLGAARRVKEAERSAAAARYRAARRKILTAVKVAWYEALAAERRLELLRANAGIARSLHRITEERFKNRVAPEGDLLKAAIELSLGEIEARDAERELRSARRELAARIGRFELALDRLEGELHDEYEAPSEESLRGEVLVNHPGLEAARHDARAAELEIESGRAPPWPDVGVAFTGGRGEEGDAVLELGLEIPLPLSNRGQAKLQAAELRAQQAKRRVEAATQEVLLALRRAHSDLLSAHDRTAAYRDDVLPKAEEVLRQAEVGYRVGEFPFWNVLDAQRTLAAARLAALSSRRDLERAVGALEELLGRRLRALR
jgi:cobalt-zinc-cadmium efflux system outer membrane protein